MGGIVNRIEILKSFLDHEPGDSFSRYALGMEYAKKGQMEEAKKAFEYVLEHDPGYVATYFQLAQVYRTLGLRHDAEKTYRTGITVASKAGDAHTREELEAALENLLTEE